MFKRFSYFLLFALTPGLCLSKGITEKQVASFELSGVKIGMTEELARKALIEKYNVTQNKIDSNVSTNYDLGKKVTNYITLKTDASGSVDVYFDLDVTAQPYTSVVSSVTYSVPNTPENVKNLREGMTKRYGAHSFLDMTGSRVWCQMEKNQCKEGTTILKVNAGTIYMKNDKYQQARFKLKQSKMTRTTNF